MKASPCGTTFGMREIAGVSQIVGLLADERMIRLNQGRTDRDKEKWDENELVDVEQGSEDTELKEGGVESLTEDSIREHQRHDPVLQPIFSFLVENRLPSDLDQAKRIVSEADRMQLVEGTLYHLWWPQR